MESCVRELIIRRRRQLLVHSFIYYRLDESLVSDDTWQLWANQLVELQAHFGHIVGYKDDVFADWDASTGYHLPTTPDIERVARCLISEGTAMANELNIRDIQAGLGFKVTADFLVNELFLKPSRTDKKAYFWDASEEKRIRECLIAHIQEAQLVPGAGGEPPRPGKAAAPAPVVANSIDDDDEL